MRSKTSNNNNKYKRQQKSISLHTFSSFQNFIKNASITMNFFLQRIFFAGQFLLKKKKKHFSDLDDYFLFFFQLQGCCHSCACRHSDQNEISSVYFHTFFISYLLVRETKCRKKMTIFEKENY